MTGLSQCRKETATNELRFEYDGWNLIATLNSQLSTLKSFAWGLDLSGSMQGAGGIGGLLWMNNGSASTHFVSYDGNGNLTALVNAADGSESARYEYGPFGEVIRASGSLAGANPFRFSTKYQDDETDLLYYGYRYYNPSTGRWLSRDPIEEKGGKNLYGFVQNDAIDYFDTDGLQPSSSSAANDPPKPPAIDCSGYSSLGNQSCYTCFGKRKDGYPEKAKSVCEGFSDLYTGSSMQSEASCVATCLIAAEGICQKLPNCSDRNCCRLLAHIACYAKCGFVPTKGLPPGGAAVGALDLLPSAALSPMCQNLRLIIGR